MKVNNAINGFRQAMIKGIMADAVTFLILAAGIALLVGPPMAPEGALAAGVAVQQGFGTLAGIAVAHVMLRCTRFGW